MQSHKTRILFSLIITKRKPMKKWLINNFLPLWAKETVLADNRQLMKQNAKLTAEIALLQAYIEGLKKGVKIRMGERREGE